MSEDQWRDERPVFTTEGEPKRKPVDGATTAAYFVVGIVGVIVLMLVAKLFMVLFL